MTAKKKRAKPRRPASRDGRDALAPVRKQLIASFHDENVHAGFEKVFADIPGDLRGNRPEGQPFTLWQLLEHLRLCALDFLDCSRYPNYVEPQFPEDYWPKSESPASDKEWEQGFEGFRSTMKTFEKLLLNPSTDLTAELPGGKGRTVLRQALACLDHNAYHLGQAVLVRRLLGIWE